MIDPILYKLRSAVFFRDRGKAAARSWEDLNRTESLSSEALAVLQHEALTVLLQHCRANVPYHGGILRQKGISQADGGALEVLRQIPLMDKQTVRENFAELTASNMEPGELHKNSTSGSTGENFSFLMGGPEERKWRRPMNKLRSRTWCGVNPFARTASLWGASFDAPKRSLRTTVGGWIQPHLFLSAYELGEDEMRNYAEQLAKYRPALLTSYPSPLSRFAEFCREEKVQLPSLKSIIVSAEQLFPHQRKLIEEVFQVPVFNRYGCREFGDIAMECHQHEGLHIFSDRVIVETINENGEPCRPGEPGEIAVTDLDNYSMPFLRYRIGDMGVLGEEPCSCGNQLPILKSVEGRVFDLIRTSSGRTISGTFWTLLTRHVSEKITGFQIHQIAPDEIILHLQTNNNVLDSDEEAMLREKISSHAPELEVAIKYVDRIALTRSGKRKFVVRAQELDKKSALVKLDAP